MDTKADMDIAAAIGRERRPATQIGSDLDYTRVTRGVRALLITVIAIVAILFALSLGVKVEEVARARGNFTPVNRVQVIQTPEGGAVASMLVRNGERVARGQLLAKFRAAELMRDIERTDVRMAYLQINIERLDAFADQRDPVFQPFEAQYSTMVSEAAALHLEQTREFARNLEQKDRQIDEEKAAIAAAQNEIPAAKSSLDASRDLLTRIREGVEKGVVALNRQAQVEEQAAQAERVHTQLVSSLDQHQARIDRLQAERAALIAKATADARNQRAALIVEMNELKATQTAYRSRSLDVDVVAPVDGIVQKISDTPVGTVVPPGGTVAEIVPTEGGVLMQAHVSPRDIGFVRLGQKAIVKSDAFDFGRFGSIPGEVVRISASNTQDLPGQEPYILVEIKLDQPYVGEDRAHVVTPGMTGEATILTGQKTIFQYLLKPIYLTLDTAFHER